MAGKHSGPCMGQSSMVTCLLIDRDPAERRRLSSLLSGLGMSTSETAGAGEGIAFCNDNTPDLVLLQATGQDVEPHDFVRRVRRNSRSKKPVVILYAEKPDASEIGQSILEGAADFLVKPFDRDLLAFKLKQAGVITR